MPKSTKEAKIKTTKTSSKASKKSNVINKKNTKAVNKEITKNKKTPKLDPLKNEYYDLPYKYNQTIVKILYQSPTSLFIYWEVSDNDKEKYIKAYGENFFENTRPVLLIHNETMNYEFEVNIEDYANSWYVNIHDSNCKYTVKLIRKPINANINLNSNYLSISCSNEMTVPNNHILFDNNQKTIYFKNAKTNETYSKDITNVSFMRKVGKIYNIYDLYKTLYKNETIDCLTNPTSYSNKTKEK